VYYNHSSRSTIPTLCTGQKNSSSVRRKKQVYLNHCSLGNNTEMIYGQSDTQWWRKRMYTQLEFIRNESLKSKREICVDLCIIIVCEGGLMDILDFGLAHHSRSSFPTCYSALLECHSTLDGLIKAVDWLEVSSCCPNLPPEYS